MTSTSSNSFIWNSEVRAYELDLQGIVNNAVYLNYLDHVRVQHLASKGVNWEKWHEEGYNLVLIHVDMELKNSLRANDKFFVTSSMEQSGRLKIIFKQAIYREPDNKLIANAINTVVCVSVQNGKPVMPERLANLLFTR